eukprot:Clim_evm7s68 gene=Clim_evmTU7s68
MVDITDITDPAQFDELPDEFYEAYKRGDIPRYKYHMDLDNWEEEIERHPLLMTKAPEGPIDPEKAPALAALQAIIHEEQDPNEKARWAKENGNSEYLKNGGRKGDQRAVLAYTEGISTQVTDLDMLAALFANRAQANLRLKNYGSCLKDVIRSLRIKPDYNVKVYFRGAKAATALERFDQADKFLEKGLEVDPGNTALVAQKKETDRLRAVWEKSQRMRAERRAEKEALRQKYAAMLEERNIQIVDEESGSSMMARQKNYDGIDWQAKLSNPLGCELHIDPEDGDLHWPVFFLYPEFQQSDFVQDWGEHTTFQQHCDVLFAEPAPWDTKHTYTPESVEIFVETHNTKKVREDILPVPKDATLRQVLGVDHVAVVNGIPKFIVFSKRNEAAKLDFFKRHFDS